MTEATRIYSVRVCFVRLIAWSFPNLSHVSVENFNHRSFFFSLAPFFRKLFVQIERYLHYIVWAQNLSFLKIPTVISALPYVPENGDWPSIYILLKPMVKPLHIFVNSFYINSEQFLHFFTLSFTLENLTGSAAE